MKIGGLNVSKRNVPSPQSSTTKSKKQKQCQDDKLTIHQEDNQDNQVKLVLHNFNSCNFPTEVEHFRLAQLKQHWWNYKNSPIHSFKYQFDQVATIDGSLLDDSTNQYLFTNPYDVKISHTHHVIVVLDNLLGKVLFFNEDSLELYHCLDSTSTTMEEPNSIALELEYCEKGTDALYLSFEGKLIKYDVERLLESEEMNSCQVWMQENFDFPTSTVISYGSREYNSKHHFSENTVYVCDGRSDCIAILEASSGEPLTMIEFNFEGTPHSIDFLNNRQLVVSLYESIVILEMDLNKGWKCVQKIDGVSDCSYLICDQHSNTIIATTQKGLILIDAKTASKKLQIFNDKANALALDGIYLYYCIPANKTIAIFE